MSKNASMNKASQKYKIETSYFDSDVIETYFQSYLGKNRLRGKKKMQFIIIPIYL